MEKKTAFERGFEEKIPQAVIVDPLWGEQLMEVMDPSLFDMVHTRKIAEILRDHYYNYTTFPSMNLLETICNREIEDEVLSKRCLDYLVKMKQNPLNNDVEWVKEKSLEFFRLQTVIRALNEEILPRIETGQKLEDIVQVFQTAVSKGTNRNIGYDYNEDDEKRFESLIENKVPTPWEFLNNLLEGGFGAKRLVTWIGPAGGGKSSLLVGCGVGALLQPKADGTGRTVVHYTLELDELEVARKYDACITGVPINDVPGNKEKVLHSLKGKLPEGARLLIKEYPMKSASVQTIKSHLSRLKLKGIFPDMIILDYGDLLRNIETNAKEERRHGLEAIWQDLKALAQVLGIPIITATQTNRSGYASDVITPDQVSEDFSKIMTSDIVITLARNMAQKVLGIGKMYVAKNRQGKDGMIYAYSIDTARCQIEMFELTSEVEEEMNPGQDKAGEDAGDVRAKLAKHLAKRKVG
jgi:hypothetical protein